MSHEPQKITLKSGNAARQIIDKPIADTPPVIVIPAKQTKDLSEPPISPEQGQQGDEAQKQIVRVISKTVEVQSATHGHLQNWTRAMDDSRALDLTLLSDPHCINVGSTLTAVHETSDFLDNATGQMNTILKEIATTKPLNLKFDSQSHPDGAEDVGQESDSTIIYNRSTSTRKIHPEPIDDAENSTSPRALKRPTRSSTLVSRFNCESCYITLYGQASAEQHEKDCSSKPAKIKKIIPVHDVPSSTSISSSDNYVPGQDVEEAFF